MGPDVAVRGVQDIQDDLVASARAARQIEAFFRRPVPAEIPFGGLPGLGGVVVGLRIMPGPGSGRYLLGRMSEINRQRYQVLLSEEQRWPADSDHIFLIGPACWVLEAELERVLAAPARAIVPHLIDALRLAGDAPAQVEILQKWHADRLTTIGVCCTLLLALRRGCEQGVQPVLSFLGANFQPPYLDLVRSKELGRCLNEVRATFRNPACHGRGSFDALRYEQFVRLVVSHQKFGGWDLSGPVPAAPGPGTGILHHHLAQSRAETGAATAPPAPPAR
jgi:hypothetical protein